MLSAPRLRAASLLVVMVSVLGTSCAVKADASGWDDPLAKTHFVDACTVDKQVETDGGKSTVVETELASKSFCTCVFEDLKSKHKLEWDKMLEFEKAQADAKDGELPTVPAQVDKAIEACRSVNAAGPVVPGSN